MHWCAETLGPRYSASVACLLGCVYNEDTNHQYEAALGHEKTRIMNTMRQCEIECNQRYMSLIPVEKN